MAAKYEVQKRVLTPDGVEHPTIEAANAHMRAMAIKIVARAGEADLRYAIETPDTQNEQAMMLRDAIRDVYLQVLPRAPKGSKTPVSASEPQPALQDGGTSDPVGAGPLELPPEPQAEPTAEPTAEQIDGGEAIHFVVHSHSRKRGRG